MLSQYNRISGGNRVLFEYANRLQEMGHAINLYVIAKPARWYRIDHWQRMINKKVNKISPESIDWMENRIPINVLSYNDERLIPDSDVLFATAWQTADFANRLPDSKGRKYYFVQHHESLWTREKDKAQKTYNMPFKKLVVSTWLKDILREKYQQEAEVFINPINKKLFYREGVNPGNATRVCLLHHDYAWKGYKDAMEAVRILRSRNSKIEPVVFGEKLEDPSSLFTDAGFTFEYHYRPTGETLRRLYSSCGVYLCASWYEGSGLPAMEAMACGATLVTTDTGGSRDFALDGETALVSPAQQPEQLANNLARVLSDEILRDKLIENGSRKIGEFSWEANSLRLEKLFQESLGDPK
ncbi:MAG: glycosyltransferase family 4 protein [Nitrospina sp.]|nr:glycosyltransferase family 4 protein [Nitrospina sp.]